MKRSEQLILVRQVGGKGLEDIHKSDMEELKEQEDLGMVWQRMAKRMTVKNHKKFRGGRFINFFKVLTWETAN